MDWHIFEYILMLKILQRYTCLSKVILQALPLERELIMEDLTEALNLEHIYAPTTPTLTCSENLQLYQIILILV
jgi:hypothetical protein